MPYDLVIKNGVLIDGTGLPRHHADVAVRHGRIVATGRLREGAREVIDTDDLPAGARRLVQRARGIAATIVNGEILMRDGKHTGALPGQLLRGPLARRA